MRNFKRRFAFTLAEVLITLGIIGIVAALTIPTLIANYQKTEELTGLKKAYAEITEALKLMANDGGCPDDLRCSGAFDGNTTDLVNALKKYIKISKDCGMNKYDKNDERTKCWSNAVAFKYNGGSRGDMNALYNSLYSFITADGFSVYLYAYDCTLNEANEATNLNLNQACARMIIDVNGLKGPNNIGRDIFWFYITNGKGPALYPDGGSEWQYNGSPSNWSDPDGNPLRCQIGDPNGQYCAGRIIEQGWQMLY